MAKTSFVGLLQDNFIFGGLSEAEAADLERYAVQKSFAPRKPIFYRGDPGDGMFIITAGQVKVSVLSPQGKECVLNFLGPGDGLGEIALLDGGPRTADATATSHVETIALQRRDVKAFLAKHPHAAASVIEALCGRIRHASSMVEDSILFDGGPRLARALLRLAGLRGREEGDGLRIELQISQSNLGAHVRLARTNVNRQMRIWVEMGLIDFADGVVTIKNPDALMDIAEAIDTLD